MNRKQVMQAGRGLLILALVLAFGCATPDTPGSDNSTKTGTVLRVVSIVAKDGGTSSNQVDVVIHMCSATEAEKGLFDVDMDVSLMNDSAGSGAQQGTKVTIISYTVEYISNDPGSVPLPAESKVTQSMVINPGGSVNMTGLLLMSVHTKEEFISRGGDPGLIPVYQAKVTFYGVNDFGYKVKAVGSTYLELADWNTC